VHTAPATSIVFALGLALPLCSAAGCVGVTTDLSGDANSSEPPPDPCAPAAPASDAGVQVPPGMARQVIVLIGDGTGAAHWEAARVAAGGTLAVDALEGPSLYATDALPAGTTTDSAAAATAIATGQCTFNGRIGVDGSGLPHRNLMEYARAAAMGTGIVTNTVIVDATPMAFVGHSGSRYCSESLAAQLIDVARPDVVLGGFIPDSAFAGPGLDERARAAGYSVGFELSALRAAAADAEPDAPVLGLFGEGPSSPLWTAWDQGLTPEILRDAGSDEPTLAEMTRFALERLASDDSGFVLMVESEHADTVGHLAYLDVAQAAVWMPSLVLELDAAVAEVLAWVESHSSFDDTLVVVCADHETGGYTLAASNPEDLAGASFPSSPNHTPSAVPIFARGPGSERLSDVKHLSDIFQLLTGNLDALPGTGRCREN